MKAIHVIIFVFLLCSCSSSVLTARSLYSVKEIVYNIDSTLLSQKNTRIQYTWISKPVHTPKIFTTKVNLTVNKQNPNKDSIGSFIFENLGFYYQIFHDTDIYFVNNAEKLINVTNFDQTNFNNTDQFIRKFCLPLFRPFIRNTFHPSKLPLYYRNQIACDTILDGKNLIYLCFNDSTDELTYDSIEVWVDHDFKYYKIRNTYLDNLASESAYSEFKDFIYLQKNSITPELFLDSLLKNSFKLIYQKQENINDENILDTIVTSLEFELKNSKGEVYNYNKLQYKYIVIEFANINCPFCFRSIPFFNNLSKSKDILPIWIDSYDTHQIEYAEEIYRKKNVLFNVLYDKDQRILKQYKVNLFPTTFIIDRQTNKILKRLDGYSDNNERLINEILHLE